MPFISDLPDATTEELKPGVYISAIDTNKSDSSGKNIKIPFETLQAKINGDSSNQTTTVSPLGSPAFGTIATGASPAGTPLVDGVVVVLRNNTADSLPIPTLKGFRVIVENPYWDGSGDMGENQYTQLRYQIWGGSAGDSGYTKKIDEVHDVEFLNYTTYPNIENIIFPEPLDLNTSNIGFMILIGRPDLPADATSSTAGIFTLVQIPCQLLNAPSDVMEYFGQGDQGMMSDQRFIRNSGIFSSKRIQDITDITNDCSYYRSTIPWIELIISG